MSRFVADVGGTNIRIATITASGELTHIRKFPCTDFSNIDSAFLQYFQEFNQLKFSHGCIAIAGPVDGDAIQMVNHSWSFSIIDLKQTLDLHQLYVINDFTAVAHSIPVLSANQLIQIGDGTCREKGNIAVFGPGTGLGVEHMCYRKHEWHTLDGEGGHVDFSPIDETDIIIYRYLLKQLERVSAEDVLSGRGIVNIYNALIANSQSEAHYFSPAQITEAAVAGNCPVCIQTLAQFCRILGSFAGNLALNLAARGGVYIGGGIASRFTDFIKESDFRQRFEAKGRMAGYVKDIPTYLISERDHGLLGAAAYLSQQTRSSSSINQ